MSSCVRPEASDRSSPRLEPGQLVGKLPVSDIELMSEALQSCLPLLPQRAVDIVGIMIASASERALS